MSLEGVGFGEGQGRFPSMISLKLLLPTFLASWVTTEKRVVNKQHFITFCLFITHFHRLTKSSEVPSLSSSMDWMREMWTPISRWMPEHSMQVRIPRLVDSHLGSGTRELAGLINSGCGTVFTLIYLPTIRWISQASKSLTSPPSRRRGEVQLSL